MRGCMDSCWTAVQFAAVFIGYEQGFDFRPIFTFPKRYTEISKRFPKGSKGSPGNPLEKTGNPALNLLTTRYLSDFHSFVGDSL